jgi:hypothetical protein
MTGGLPSHSGRATRGNKFGCDYSVMPTSFFRRISQAKDLLPTIGKQLHQFASKGSSWTMRLVSSKNRRSSLLTDAVRYGSNATASRMTFGDCRFYEHVMRYTALRQLASSVRAAARNTSLCCSADAVTPRGFRQTLSRLVTTATLPLQSAPPPCVRSRWDCWRRSTPLAINGN